MLLHEIALSVNITSWCHNTKITHSAHCHLRGDGNELDVSFNSLLSFETATDISLSNGYCSSRLLKLSAGKLF